MDFAREHLKQLGWQEGEGLGRERHGISEALKPKLKFDNCGVGHDPAREFTHTWWSEAYNSAAAKVTVTEATDGVRLAAAEDEGSKKKKKKKEKKVKTKQAYSNFVTGGTLTGAQVTGESAADAEKEEEPPAAVTLPSDEQLLAACGGRTAHKGARHGHRMDGKLARIIAQEAAILARLTGKPELPAQPAQEEPAEGDKKSKKKKRKRETVEEADAVTVEECEVKDSVSDDVKSEKKKKKKRKDVENTVNEPEACENGAHESVPEKKKKKKRKTQDS